MRITYDAEGRDTQYLFGVDGDGSLLPWILPCETPAEGLPRGTVVEVAYASGGFRANTVTTETCNSSLERVCETLTFDGARRFLERDRSCEDRNGPFFAQGTQTRYYDDRHRPTRDSVVGPPHLQPLWQSGELVLWSCPADDTVVIDAPGPIDGVLTRYLGPDGRPIRSEFRVTVRTDVSEVVTNEYDTDGCGMTESADLWNDGVTDIVTKTTCTNGRVTRREERNMTSLNDWNNSGSLRPHHETPLGAPPQGIAAFDFAFDANGNITARSYDVTSLRDIYKVARSQHETFTYGAAEVRAVLDRALTNVLPPWDYVDFDPEASQATCTLSNACTGAPNADPARALCQAVAAFDNFFARAGTLVLVADGADRLWVGDLGTRLHLFAGAAGGLE